MDGPYEDFHFFSLDRVNDGFGASSSRTEEELHVDFST
jgi:hypothetical protein